MQRLIVESQELGGYLVIIVSTRQIGTKLAPVRTTPRDLSFCIQKGPTIAFVASQ